MCHLCRTYALAQRIENHIKNLDAGGAINPEAIRSVLAEALADLSRYQQAASLTDAILSGKARVEIDALAESHQPMGKPH